VKITSLQRKAKFDKDFKALPVDLQVPVKTAVADLLKDPIPASRRLHHLTGFKNPKVYTIDVLPNHAYKLSFEVDGEAAILRRVTAHKTIDRNP